MKKIISSLTLVLCFQYVVGQETVNPLAFFEHLMGKTWTIDAKWGDGSPFKQELIVEYGLEDKLIYAHTRGFVDVEKTRFGDRSVGVRQYNIETGKIHFWEFDVWGGTTEGEVISNGRDIWYIYSYQGTTLADIWEYLDDETYAFRVVQYDNEEVGHTYLKGVYKLKD